MNSVITGRKPWPLLLTGGVGTGKTLAALCLLDAVGGGSVYATVSEMCEDTQTAMRGELYDDNGAKVNTRIYWHNWREAKCTVLDELGSREKVSDHHYECVKRALDCREGKACVYISNLDLDGIARVYDDRIASRLAQGTVIQTAGHDRRVGGN